MRTTIAVLLALFASGVSATRGALPERDAASVAGTTPVFAFYSDPTFNLHDSLVWKAQSREPVEPAVDCLQALPAEERAAVEPHQPA